MYCRQTTVIDLKILLLTMHTYRALAFQWQSSGKKRICKFRFFWHDPQTTKNILTLLLLSYLGIWCFENNCIQTIGVPFRTNAENVWSQDQIAKIEKRSHGKKPFPNLKFLVATFAYRHWNNSGISPKNDYQPSASSEWIVLMNE